jgi:hypothetical protein
LELVILEIRIGNFSSVARTCTDRFQCSEIEGASFLLPRRLLIGLSCFIEEDFRTEAASRIIYSFSFIDCRMRGNVPPAHAQKTFASKTDVSEAFTIVGPHFELQ